MTTSSAQARIAELDGLRGMAILSVLLFHYIADDQVHVASGTFLSAFRRCFAMGWAGVDLFFVLSGFLIGGILLDARDSGGYFRTFYARRFFRIMPLYYLWIGVFFLAVLTAFHASTGLLGGNPENARTALVYALFSQNSIKMAHGVLGTAWLGQLWSLAVEEQFYLVMPLAIRFLPRRKLISILCLTVVAAPVIRLLLSHFVPQHPAAQYVLTPCRADALAMGVLLAVGWREQRWKEYFHRYRRCIYGVTAALGVIVLYLAAWNPSQYTHAMAAWGFSCVDAFCACLLAIAIMAPTGVWAAVCRIGFLAELGGISYCLYVIHQAANLFCHEALLGAAARFVDWRTAGVTVLAAASAYGLAKLSWFYFERPLLRRGHAYRYVPRPAASPSVVPEPSYRTFSEGAALSSEPQS